MGICDLKKTIKETGLGVVNKQYNIQKMCQDCTLETCIILLTNVTPVNSIKKESCTTEKPINIFKTTTEREKHRQRRKLKPKDFLSKADAFLKRSILLGFIL